jgi:hypothetical protein
MVTLPKCLTSGLRFRVFNLYFNPEKISKVQHMAQRQGSLTKKKQGSGNVVIRVYYFINGDHFYHTTGVSLSPNLFDKIGYVISNTQVDWQNLNNQIMSELNKVNVAIQKLPPNGTKEDLKNLVAGKPLQPQTPVSVPVPVQKFGIVECLELFYKDSEDGTRQIRDGAAWKEVSEGRVAAILSVYRNVMNFAEYVKGSGKDLYDWSGYLQDDFYKEYCDWSWDVKGMFDGGLGKDINVIVAAINYSKTNKIKKVSSTFSLEDFHKMVDTPPVITVTTDEVKYLLHFPIPKALKYLELCRDYLNVNLISMFRVGDLTSLTTDNLEKNAGGTEYTLKLETDKTGVFVEIPLHYLATNVIKKYEKQLKDDPEKRILPSLSSVHYNRQLKLLFDTFANWVTKENKAGRLLGADIRNFKGKYVKTRKRRGKSVVIKKEIKDKAGNIIEKRDWKWSEIITSHVFRKTGITNALKKMRPDEVKQLSGHSENSSAFFRYVAYQKDDLKRKSHSAVDDYVLTLEDGKGL